MQFIGIITALSKKSLLFSMGALVFVAISISYYYWNHKQMHPNSLWEILDYYGFNSPVQKKSLEFLMKKADIIKPTETFTTLFPKRDNVNLLFKDVLNFVELTQQHFTVRSGAQERWEVQPAKWMEKDQPEILNALTNLKLTEAIIPS